jgi:hypothetical protein
VACGSGRYFQSSGGNRCISPAARDNADCSRHVILGDRQNAARRLVECQPHRPGDACRDHPASGFQRAALHLRLGGHVARTRDAEGRCRRGLSAAATPELRPAANHWLRDRRPPVDIRSPGAGSKVPIYDRARLGAGDPYDPFHSISKPLLMKPGNGSSNPLPSSSESAANRTVGAPQGGRRRAPITGRKGSAQGFAWPASATTAVHSTVLAAPHTI